MRVPWTARTSIQSILKETSPGCSLEGQMLRLKLQYFGHLIWRVDSLEKTLMLGGIGSRRRGGWQRMRWLDGITNLIHICFNDESTLTHYYLESIVYIRVHSWCSIFYGFGRFYKDIKTQKILNCSTWMQSQKQQNYLCLQSKPFNIIVLKVYVLTSNTEEAEVEWFSVQFSRSVVSDSLWSHESQHTRLPCPSPTPGVHSNSCASSWWCHPIDSSPPGSSVHGILQGRILEWVAISSFRGSSQPRDQNCISWVSSTGRQILYHWVSWESHLPFSSVQSLSHV